MTRLIDADAYLKKACTYNETGCGCCKLQTICPVNEPTVDAVPVIRCKDCKYYEETDETIGTCLLTISGAHVKGYCAWAERKEERN